MKIGVLNGLVVAVLAGGCASGSQTYGPDGKQAFAINCSGMARNWGMCYEKAGELCGTRGYEVINQSGDQGAGASITPSGGFGGSVISRSLLIKCKP